MFMSRNMLAAAALLSGLAAAPAFAQSQPASAPDHARTLEQNQRAYVAPPARPPQVVQQAAQQPAQAAPAKDRPVAATPVNGRRVVLADKVR
jgi:hypothetical protein